MVIYGFYDGIDYHLVGGAITILKNMSSSVGKDDIPYIMDNKKICETTNQLNIVIMGGII